MRKLAILLSLLSLVACTTVPKQSSYPLSFQQKMQASQHWEVLAQDISKDVSKRFSAITKPADAKQPTTPSSGNTGQITPDKTVDVPDSVFIADLDASPFGTALRTFLITEFESNLGIDTAPKKESSNYQLEWEVQKVFYQASRYSNDGLLLALAEAMQAILIGGNDCDFSKPHSEIIVTVNAWEFIADKNWQKRIFRQTYVFYVNDVDSDNHYSVVTNPSSAIDLTPVNFKVKEP